MNSGILEAAKGLSIRHNVMIRVIDEPTGKVVSEHCGHNAATNTLISGIGHYLMGEGTFTNGELLRDWIPQYISLGTMGLSSQEEDEYGLPAGIGDASGTEEERFKDYLSHCPGYGSDGYDETLMNGREYAGLGPVYANRKYRSAVECELISDSFPRSNITYREVVPEYKSEIPKTIDVIFSAMVSTGALAKFRDPGKGYIFITETGLWSTSKWSDSAQNGMLAGYRICPPDEKNWDMSDPTNRKILKENIIKIGTNQVAQIIWKIQLGGLEQLIGKNQPTPSGGGLEWNVII